MFWWEIRKCIFDHLWLIHGTLSYHELWRFNDRVSGLVRITTVVNGYTSMFSTIFTKGINFCYFLFASLGDKALSKWGLLLKEFSWVNNFKSWSRLRRDAKIEIVSLLLKVYLFALRLMERDLQFYILFNSITFISEWSVIMRDCVQ